MKRAKIKKLGKIAIIGVLTIGGILLLTNIWVIISGSPHVQSDYSELQTERNVVLVLGTSKSLKNGNKNPFFYNRIEAAYTLYKEGKASHFILSGDHSEKYYNEPLDMKNALMEKGVPDSVITMDYAGLSTLDSVVRAKLIFGQDELLVVTQKFHSFRTAFLCKSFGIDAEVFLAESVPFRHSTKVHIREFFARPRAVLDVYLVHRTPKHLGEKIDIEEN